MPSKRENNSRNNQKSGSNDKKPSTGSNASDRGRKGNTGGEGLDDITYDVISVLHEKCKGLEVYEEYIEDAEGNEEVRQIFEELRDQDREAVSRLEECLRNLIGEGAESSSEEEEDVA